MTSETEMIFSDLVERMESLARYTKNPKTKESASITLWVSLPWILEHFGWCQLLIVCRMEILEHFFNTQKVVRLARLLDIQRIQFRKGFTFDYCSQRGLMH